MRVAECSAGLRVSTLTTFANGICTKCWNNQRAAKMWVFRQNHLNLKSLADNFGRQYVPSSADSNEPAFSQQRDAIRILRREIQIMKNEKYADALACEAARECERAMLVRQIQIRGWFIKQ